jgi:serine/threonine protein kinase/formylglycine-generating enzyme required for sulfatase activity
MADLDRDLLFALLALRSNLIASDELLTAFAEMAPDETRPLGAYLIGRGDLEEAEAAAVERQMAAWSGAVATGDRTPDLDRTRAGNDGTSEVTATQLDPFATRAPAPPVGGDDPFATRVATASPVGSTDAGWGSEPARFSEFAVRARRFHRMRLLARGGLGAVFVAHDNELNREVALKEILELHADDFSSQARFLLEAEITGSLEHPGIVPVYGLGKYSDGRPYYAMRLIQGNTLGDAIKQHHEAEGPGRDPGERLLGLRKLLSQFIEVCNALAYAHSKGVIHRDVKPGNVMLGKFGETLLVDWGLAKRIGKDDAEPESESSMDPFGSERSETDLIQTMPGTSFGTPHFMSPEQATGDVANMGAACDVYSLGASLYVLLTGRLPFQGREYHQVLAGTIDGDFPPPRQVNRLVHPALEAVCLKAMARKPDDRYASARALADDIERWLADEPVTAWHEPRSVQALRWVKVHRTLVTSVAAALLMATMGVGYAVYASGLRETEHRVAADGWVRTLAGTEIDELPRLLEQSRPERRWILPILAQRVNNPRADSKDLLHVALALVWFDPSRLDDRLWPLYNAMLNADPIQLPVIRDALKERSSVLIPHLWKILEDPAQEPIRRFNAGSALASFDSPTTEADRARWKPHGEFLVQRCIDEISRNAGRLLVLQETFRPAARVLFEPLLRMFRDRDPSRSSRRSIAVQLIDAYADRIDELVELLLNADANEYSGYLKRLESDKAEAIERLDREIRTTPVSGLEAMPENTDSSAVMAAMIALAEYRKALAERQGRAGVALVMLGAADRAWPSLRHSSDPSVRSELIHGLARYGADPSFLVRRLRSEPDLSSRRALILALGEYPVNRLPEADRNGLVDLLVQWFRHESDPGLHSAIDWLLRVRWGEGSRLEPIARDLAIPADRDWYVNGEGQTLAILRGPIAGDVGSPEQELAPRLLETRHPVRIDRSIAIGTREVTDRQYSAFLDDNPDLKPLNPIGHPILDFPMLSVNFFDAIHYCNWLSAREGIPESEWPYPKDVRRGMTLPRDYLHRTGYRLPTEAEWELACRAGASTARYFGESDAMAGHYAWTRLNSGSFPHPVAQLKPNDLGLFDALGNAWEWTMDAGSPYAIAANGPTLDNESDREVSDDTTRVLRGGSFDYGPEMSRSANRPGLTPSSRYYTLGFRVARTLPPAGKAR